MSNPLVIDENGKVILFSDNQTYLKFSVSVDEERQINKPVAEKYSPPYTISTVVCQPSASLEQHARNRRVIYSYTLLSSPARLPACAVG